MMTCATLEIFSRIGRGALPQPAGLAGTSTKASRQRRRLLSCVWLAQSVSCRGDSSVVGTGSDFGRSFACDARV
jgi:hypothetical protein